MKIPRFIQTVAETSKPPLTKLIVINKPLGLAQPTTLKTAYSIDLFSSKAKELRQQKLDHDLKHSPMYESKSFTNTNGKIFQSPISYFKSEKSLYFPDFAYHTITNKQVKLYKLLKDKISLIRIYLTQSGENCVNSYFKNSSIDYLKQYEEFIKKYPNCQIIDLNIPQGWLKSWLIKLVSSNIKNNLPEQRRDKYFILPETLFPFNVKQQLFCDNSCGGYIYFVDSDGKIRWCTSGYSNEEEQKLFDKVIRGLNNINQ